MSSWTAINKLPGWGTEELPIPSWLEEYQTATASVSNGGNTVDKNPVPSSDSDTENEMSDEEDEMTDIEKTSPSPKIAKAVPGTVGPPSQIKPVQTADSSAFKVGRWIQREDGSLFDQASRLPVRLIHVNKKRTWSVDHKPTKPITDWDDSSQISALNKWFSQIWRRAVKECRREENRQLWTDDEKDWIRSYFKTHGNAIDHVALEAFNSFFRGKTVGIKERLVKRGDKIVQYKSKTMVFSERSLHAFRIAIGRYKLKPQNEGEDLVKEEESAVENDTTLEDIESE